ncbi:MAG: glycosyltransferase [Spirochaetaceae bacterium]|nr:glycosyltransferase [Spirochaetaceae bacterium]
MTIALFSDSYLPTKSGIVTVVVQLREQLIALGHRVILVTVETTDEYATDDPDIYRVHSVPLGLGTDQFLGIPVMHPLINYLKSCNIDIIHCHTEFGVAKAGLRAARILKIPAICTTHTMWTDFYKYYIPFGKWISPNIINSILNRFYGKFNSLIGVSTKARNYFKQKNMLPNTPSVIIPNAIDRSQFQKTHVSEEQKHKLRESYGIKDNEVLALFVGRIAEEKRVFELLEICKNVIQKDSTCKFMFVGSGPACEEMKERAKPEIESGKIIFTGFVEWAKVHEFYESGDLFITSSLSEMHSMTILEAQLSALPIVVRRDESYLDCIFDGENGFLTDSDEELEEKILELVKDSQKRKQFGIRSLEIASKFTIETHVARTLFVYNEVIKAYPGKIDDVIVNKQVAEL